MTVTGDGGKRPHRFGTHLVLVMLLVTLPVIGLISALDYQEVEGALIAEDGLLREQTERSVMQSIHLVDAGMKLFDNTLNREMQEGFGPFIAEYERAGRDPGAMDLLPRPEGDRGGYRPLHHQRVRRHRVHHLPSGPRPRFQGVPLLLRPDNGDPARRCVCRGPNPDGAGERTVAEIRLHALP